MDIQVLHCMLEELTATKEIFADDAQRQSWMGLVEKFHPVIERIFSSVFRKADSYVRYGKISISSANKAR